MSDQQGALALEQALAAKGIGPQGNRSLETDILKQSFDEMAAGITPAAMEAAFIAAFRILSGREEEENVFQEESKRVWNKLPSELRFLLGDQSSASGIEIEDVINRLLNAEDLSEAECQTLHKALISDEVPVRYKAALLQGLRVKRETDLENRILLKSMLEDTPFRSVDHALLIDLCDPYDGMVRGPSLSFYLAIVLSALEVPVVLHNVSGLGPKYGQTFLDVLNALGIKTQLDFGQAVALLNDCNLALLDQQYANPNLYKLMSLRNDMKKRPYLATIEKCLAPIRSKERHVQVCGYVHKAYIEAIPEMLLSNSVCDELILVKGMEGSVLFDAKKKVRLFHGQGANQMQEHVVQYLDSRHDNDKTCESEMDFAELILSGEHSCSSHLIFSASEILYLCGVYASREESIQQVQSAMDAKNFTHHFKKVLQKLRQES